MFKYHRSIQKKCGFEKIDKFQMQSKFVLFAKNLNDLNDLVADSKWFRESEIRSSNSSSIFSEDSSDFAYEDNDYEFTENDYPCTFTYPYRF
jgi:hypothetical protein